MTGSDDEPDARPNVLDIEPMVTLQTSAGPVRMSRRRWDETERRLTPRVELAQRRCHDPGDEDRS